MKAGMLNPFLRSLPVQCQDMTGRAFKYHDAKVLKLQDMKAPKKQNWRIEVPVSGQLNGKVVYSLDHQSALDLASSVMFDLPVAELDDMAMNALIEVAGRAAAKAALSLAESGYQCKVERPRVVAENVVYGGEGFLGIRLILEADKGLQITTDLFLREVPAHRIPSDGRVLH